MQKLKFKSILTRLAVLLILGQTFISPISVFAGVINQSETEEQLKEEKIQEPLKDSETGNIENEIKEPEKQKVEEVAINENARSKASPISEPTEKIQEETIIQEQSVIDELGSLSVGEDGKIYYKGEPLYVGENGEEIPADLNELMKLGVPQKLTMRSARATTVGIQYNGQVSYGGTIVGDFTVNGKTAFCLQHPKPTPPTGTQGVMSPYEKDEIKRIMYYGWEGPENIFGSDRARGIVVTSLVLSKYYNGDVSGTSIPGWVELDNLAQNGEVPHIDINATAKDLTVSIKNRKQVSQSTTILASPINELKIPVPTGLTLVNETTGQTVTNGTATVKGGQTVHFEASLTYTNNYSTGKMSGSVKAFQPLVIRPTDSGLQDIGTWQWYDDPTKVVEIKADFFARLGDVHLIKEDRETITAQGDATLDGAVYRITDSVGTSRDVTIQNGKATAKDLLIGEITYQEIKAPIGYLLDPTVYRATLDYNSQTGKIEITRTVKEDVIKGNVDIMKYYSLVEGSAILIPEKGAGFSIYLESNGNLVQTQETNALGHARFNNLPFGSYLVKQTKSPAGTLPVADFKVKVDEHGQTYFYNILNGKFKSPTKLIKADFETGKNVLVPGTIFKIKDLETGLWVNQTTHNITEFVTDENGEVLLYDELRFGDYELHEIKAPAGYVLNKTPHKFSVNQESQENGMIVVKFANKAQKGKVILNKTGEVATGSKIKDTEYGKQYEFEYSQKPLAGSEFNVIATKDIITGDGTMYHQKGDIAGTATTDENGKLTIGDLHLGSYALVETKAPKGYVLDWKEYPFELTYAGQEVEVTTAEVSVKNVLQDLVIKINKTEESAKWEDGKVVIEEVPSNGKVFGVYSDQDFSYNKNVIVPANSLVGVATTKEGIAGIQQKYPEGKFFVKELDAGNDHVINPNEFKFEFTAQDNNKTLEIGIWGDSVAYGKQNLLKIARNPITNELGKINVKLIKVDDEVSLTEDTPLAGVEYDLILKKDGNKEIVGHYVTDGNGEINVENIPSGDYEFVETKALTDYILDTKPIEFESTPETNGDSIEFRAVNKHMPPTLGTYASGINGQKLFNPRIENVIYDDMDYEFVYAGIDIFLTTILMEKGATPAQDKEVQRKETTIKSTGTKFTTQVGLTIPANTMDGNKDYYFVEIAHRDEERKIEYVKHDDRDDKGQTIRSEVPKIETLLAGLKGEKDFNPKKDNSMVDKVNATNFETNHEFTIVTEYVNPKTLEVVAVDEQQKIFSEQDSIFDVFLNLPANKMKSGDKLVATHRVYYDKEKTILYAEHYDLGNLKQTISFTAPKVVVLPQTGENAGTLAIMGVLIISLLAVGFLVRRNRMNKEKNDFLEKISLYGFGGEQSIFTEDEDQENCKVATILAEAIVETGTSVGLTNSRVQRLLKQISFTFTEEIKDMKPVEQY